MWIGGEWEGGQKQKPTRGWVGEWMEGWVETKRWMISEWVDRWEEGQMGDKVIANQMDRLMTVWMHVWGWWKNGWMDEWIGWRVNG